MKLLWIFLVSLGIVQILDGISTYMALRNPLAYEASGFIQGVLGNNGLAILAYEIGTFLVISVFLVAIDAINEWHWYSDDVTLFINVICVAGFLYLVLYRLIFIVMPNFKVAP